jgi:hypothetical protein
MDPSVEHSAHRGLRILPHPCDDQETSERVPPSARSLHNLPSRFREPRHLQMRHGSKRRSGAGWDRGENAPQLLASSVSNPCLLHRAARPNHVQAQHHSDSSVDCVEVAIRTPARLPAFLLQARYLHLCLRVFHVNDCWRLPVFAARLSRSHHCGSSEDGHSALEQSQHDKALLICQALLCFQRRGSAHIPSGPPT